MNETEVQFCSLCGTNVPPRARYPRYVCMTCSAKAADESGRSLHFYNESISGGFIAEYSDTGERRESHLCFIDGHKCRADEAYLGGIVIQPVPE